MKNIKRLSYKASCRNFILQHTCFFILNVLGIGVYFFIVIFPIIYVIFHSISTRGPQMIFAFVIPLGFIILAIIACINAKQYGQEIVRLLSGNFLVKTGCIVQKTKNVYTIGPVLTKNKKLDFYNLPYPALFYIKGKNCESTFQIGDSIKIIYPCSPRLSTRTTHQLYAVYAFSSAEAYSMNTQKVTANKRKKTVFIYLSVVTLLSASLLSILFVLVNMLLKQTFFR